MASIRLKWVPLPEADIQNSKIHRSMIGFKTPYEAPFGLIAGEDIVLKINNQDTQTITFPGDFGIDGIVIFLNANLVGARAYKSSYDNSLIVRSNLREAPGFIQVIGGSALSKLGQDPRIISEKSEVEIITTVPGAESVYADLDGVIQDYYAISTVDNFGNESKRCTLAQAVGFATPICVVEGKVIDLQGQRIPDVVVTAKIVTRPQITSGHSAIIKDELSVLTGEDGRFSLPLLQLSQVIFSINETRISDPIEIPEQDFVYFDDLPIYEDYRFIDYTE